MWRHIASNGLTLLIIGLVMVAAAIGWGINSYRSAGPLEDGICLRVAPGSTMRGVSADLAAQNAVASEQLFRIGASYTDKAAELKAGSFLIPERASMEQITDIITRGGASTCGTEIVYRVGVAARKIEVRELDPATGRFDVGAEFVPGEAAAPELYNSVREQNDTRYRVAVAEGVTSWQVADALRAADFLEGDLEEIPAEGFLAPDSYEVAPGSSRTSLLSQMQARQEDRLEEAWRNRADELPYDSPEEALILASIVEKETGVSEERGIVASVFVNRLEQGMRLQTDPTVIYGITGGEGVLGRGLRRSELDERTPYNTYAIDGLPPTPIANPGLDALRAAVDPPESDYLYFVADGSGGHAFAETLAAHNENVARWRAIEAERAGQ